MKSKSFAFNLLIFLVLSVGALALLATRGGQTVSTHRLRVTASFYPLAEFARQVGGDRVQVVTMVRPGVEPHDYDPAPGDLVNLYRSRLFIYNGAGLEKWIDRVAPDLAASHVVTVNASTGIALQPATAGGDTAAGAPDPHIWLDPVLAQTQVDSIADGLIRVDPAGASYYHQRAAQYKAQLDALDHSYQAGLSQCARRDIVTSHQAFGYLGARYQLDALAIAGLSPDDEPSPGKLAAVTQFVQDHHITYIFFESLVSPKLSQAIASEVGAHTLVFNPLEGLTASEISHGASYLTIQQANLNNLRIALDCK